MSDTLSIKRINIVTEFIRVFFISAELLVLGLVSTVAYLAPSAWVFVGETIKSQTDVMKYLPVLPIALCGYSIKLAWKLVSPQSGSNKLLYDWPGYWRLKLRRDVTIALCILCAGVSLIVWIFGSVLSPFWLGAIWTWALLSAMVTCGCALLAAFKLKEITEE
jgi:hypothetical protein